MVSIPRISKGQKQGFSGRFMSRPRNLEGNLGNAPGDSQQSEVCWVRVTNFEFGGCFGGSREKFSKLSGPSLRAATLSRSVSRKTNIQGERGESTSLPDRNKDLVRRLGKITIGPGDISRGQRRKRVCGTCHTP